MQAHLVKALERLVPLCEEGAALVPLVAAALGQVQPVAEWDRVASTQHQLAGGAHSSCILWS